MIVQVLRLTRWELFKVRKRWMPWILLGIAVIVTQISVWGGFSAYQSSRAPRAEEFSATFESRVIHPDGGPIELSVRCGDTLEQVVPQEVLSRLGAEDRGRLAKDIDWELRRCGGLLARESDRQEARERFVLPDSLSNALAVGSNVGVILVMILAASVIGGEYGWGTLRTALTRGIGRWQFPGAKALSLLLMSGAGLIIVGLGAVVSSLIAASLILDDGGGLADSGNWSTVLVIYGKAAYGLLPYVVLALFLSVVTSSSSMGISIGLAYYFVEAILVGILTNVFDWFSNVTDSLLGPSVIAWMTEPGVQATGGDAALFPLQDLPSQLHAFLVLTAYIVIIGTVAFWLFQHKDIAGARGERSSMCCVLPVGSGSSSTSDGCPGYSSPSLWPSPNSAGNI